MISGMCWTDSLIFLQKSDALLKAAEQGCTRCVKILLAKGAFVNEKCPECGFNCLMKAIENEHRYNITSKIQVIKFSTTIRDTVLAVLIHDFSSLRFSKEAVTPMRMLIEHIPGRYNMLLLCMLYCRCAITDVAEWVLNKCALEDDSTMDTESIDHKFEGHGGKQ